MKMRSMILCISVCALMVIGCTPKAVLTNAVNSGLPPWSEENGFVILTEEDTFNLDNGMFLSEVRVGEMGFTDKCDLGTVLNIVKQETLKIGGNAMFIKKVSPPDLWSSCYRVQVEAYYFRDHHKYEESIKWFDSRKLMIRDFKADTTYRPFEAQTVSEISYFYTRGETNDYWYINTSAWFNCKKSYFKINSDSSFILNHEQRHFDLAEVYARSVLKELKFKQPTFANLDNATSEIYQRKAEELNREQDRYDFEVYQNREKQKDWDASIDKRLTELADFKDKKIKISRRSGVVQN